MCVCVETVLGSQERGRSQNGHCKGKERGNKEGREEDNRGKKVKNGREREEQDKGKHLRNVQDNDGVKLED